MAPLSQAGQELIRNRTAQAADAGRRARGYTSDAALANWSENDDWRVRLGSSIALARHGVKAAPCTPEVRSLLYREEEEVRNLAEQVLCRGDAAICALPPLRPIPETPRRQEAAAQAAKPEGYEDAMGSQGNAEKVRELLVSNDSRLRRGALEALGKQKGFAIAQYTLDVAARLADESPEVQQAASTVLRRIGPSVSLAVADVLCKDDVSRPVGQQLMLHLAAGDRHRVDRLLREARRRAQLKADDARAPEELVETVLPTTAESAAKEMLQAESFLPEADASLIPLRPVPPSKPSPAQQRPLIGAAKTEPLLQAGRAPSFGTTEENVDKPKRWVAPNEFALLQSDAKHIQIYTLKNIGKKTMKEATPFLSAVVDKLQDQDEYVLAAAADTLGLLGSKGLAVSANLAEISKAVSATLTSSHSIVRQASARALGRMGAKDLAPAIARLLEDDDLQVQREAVLALGEFPPAAIGACAAERLQHSDVRVRAAAKRALCLSGAQSSQGKEPDATLAELRPYLEPILSHASSEVRRSAAEVIERVAQVRPSSAEADLASRPVTDDIGKMMLSGLHNARRGSLAAYAGAALLHDQDEEVREAAARRLGKLGSSSATSAAALAKCLEDMSPSVRRAAAEVIAELGQEHGALAAPAAAELLAHPLQTVRRAASHALRGLGEAAQPHDTSRNIALLTDADPTVRCNAVEALGNLGASGVLAGEQVTLVAALHIDRHWCVRLAVADALRLCGADALRRHEAALKLLATDLDWRVRRAAMAALKASDLALSAMASEAPAASTASAPLTAAVDSAAAVEADLQPTSPWSGMGANVRADVDQSRSAEEAAAALKIQKLQRGRAEREKLKSSLKKGHSSDSPNRGSTKVTFGREEQVAATRIQSSLRSRAARKEVQARREEKKREAAATRIQGFQRRQFSRGSKDSVRHRHGALETSDNVTESKHCEEFANQRASNSGRQAQSKHQNRHGHHRHHRKSSDDPSADHKDREQAAALRIQSLQRGRMARKEVVREAVADHEDEDFLVLRRSPAPDSDLICKIPNGTLLRLWGPTVNHYIEVDVMQKDEVVRGWVLRRDVKASHSDHHSHRRMSAR